MPDDFSDQQPGLDSPAASAIAITPSDSQPIAAVTRAIYVGTGGALRVTMLNGEDVTLAGLLGGVVYPLRIEKVWATGTTAGNLTGLR